MITKSTKLHTSKAPILRFPTFTGNWEEKTLGEITTLLKGSGISKEDVVEDGKNKCIRYGELYTKYGEVINDVKSRTNVPADGSLLSKVNDVLIPSSGESALDIATLSCIRENDVLLGGDINVLRLQKNQDGIFFAYYLSHSRNREIARLAQGQSVVHLYASHLKTLNINLPSFLEQQKISGLLESIDAWINTLQIQKASLEIYKKAMKQKLFAQEIRFKDDYGNDYPKWEEKKLKEILKERKEYSTKGNDFPHISLTTEGVVPKSDRYNRDFLVNDDEIKKYKVTRINDLCYNPANLKFGVITINKLGAGIFSPIYVTFEIINQDVDFIGYYLIRDAFINKARRYEQGTVYERMAVHPSDFLKVKLTLPSISEQKKIAEFLASLDGIIELKQQQIAHAKKWKEGLMQQLFV